MNYFKRQEGISQLLVVGLVAVVAVAVGFAVWQKHSTANKGAVLSSPSTMVQASSTPIPSASPQPSDESLITSTLLAYYAAKGGTDYKGTQLVLSKLQAGAAEVKVYLPNSSGYVFLLKKTAGNWVVVYTGQNYEASREQQDGLPQGFTNSLPTRSTVLYTY